MDTSLVFGIIFAIVLISFLLVFGLGQISNVFCTTNTAQADKAVKDIESIVSETFLLGEGTSMPYKVAVSSETKICFVNHTRPGPVGSWNPDITDRDFIIDEITLGKYNVWIEYGCGQIGEGYRIRHMEILTDNFCIQGYSDIYIENKGYFVTVESFNP